MNLVVVGTGYVGLVTGTCFAEMGNHVVCIDKDHQKINDLNVGIVPIYEPGLNKLIDKNTKEGRLTFQTSLAKCIDGTEVYFIAVGTPPNEDGSADLIQVIGVAREIGKYLNDYAIIIDKSTVPVGTAERVSNAIKEELLKRNKDIEFDVISNPEFLKEGDAINDFMRPDRIVVGTESIRAANAMRTLYAPFNQKNDCLLVMGTRDAEMSKYAANAMLATKISFMNEIAHICELMDVDVENVRNGIGSDSRIGYSFIHPGCGYGGSCFPKDVKALVHMARQNNMEPSVLISVEERNQKQKLLLSQKIKKKFGEDLSGILIGLWGLAFKPGTDDVREASSLELVRDLIGSGATVKAYDPVAMQSAKNNLPKEWFDLGLMKMVVNQYDAIEGADALVLVTEWDTFRILDFHRMANIMRQNVIFDGRNIYDPSTLTSFGFDYTGIGRKNNTDSSIYDFSIDLDTVNKGVTTG